MNSNTDTFTKIFAKERFNDSEQFILDNLLYEVIGGSHAYGTNNEDSDYDIVAIFMNTHQSLFPQNYGDILGFDQIQTTFDTKEIKGDGNRLIINKKEVEGEWRSLVKFFSLAVLKGSPNLIEVLFVRKQNIKFIHPVFSIVKDNAYKFISMRTFHAFKGYMFSQFHRLKNSTERNHTDNPKRRQLLDNFGYDCKMANHILRLIDLVEQMIDGETEIDLMRNKNECKAMRNGSWGNWADFEKYTSNKFNIIESKASFCKLPNKPRQAELKVILNNCIEEWYGSENGMKVNQTEYVSTKDVWEKLNNLEKLINNKM